MAVATPSPQLRVRAFLGGGGGARASAVWEFPNIRDTLFWVLIIRILLFRVLYPVWGFGLL